MAAVFFGMSYGTSVCCPRPCEPAPDPCCPPPPPCLPGRCVDYLALDPPPPSSWNVDATIDLPAGEPTITRSAVIVRSPSYLCFYGGQGDEEPVDGAMRLQAVLELVECLEWRLELRVQLYGLGGVPAWGLLWTCTMRNLALDLDGDNDNDIDKADFAPLGAFNTTCYGEIISLSFT